MRHSFANVMIENAEDVYMLGHADTSITLQMYDKYRKRENIKRASFFK
jgi:integrase